MSFKSIACAHTLLDGLRLLLSIPVENCSIYGSLARRAVKPALGKKIRDVFGHRCDIAGKTIADRAKNTEGDVTIPAFYASEIAPVQSALRCETLLT